MVRSRYVSSAVHHVRLWRVESELRCRMCHAGHGTVKKPARRCGAPRRASGGVGARMAVISTLVALHIEPEVHHVAVLDDVFFAFDPEFADFAAAFLTAMADKVVVAHDLSLNEAALKVGVDDASRLRGA